MHSLKSILDESNRTPWLLALLMVSASVLSIVARPITKINDLNSDFSLEKTIPLQFESWRNLSQDNLQVVNPQTQQMLDLLYREILTRVYVSDAGYRVMVSVAYGSDQRDSMQAHKPERCYPAQGFAVSRNESAFLQTDFGTIPIRRLFAFKATRIEPVTYWYTVGEKAVHGQFEKRLEEIRIGLTGRIADGILFRVSSLDSDTTTAYQMHDKFLQDLLKTLSPRDRKRLSGLSR